MADDVEVSLEDQERAKYEKAWQLPAYSASSPAFNLLPAFMSMVRPEPGEWFCDYGCGTGQASLWLYWYGLEPVLFDLTPKGLATNVLFRLAHRFIKGCLWEPGDLGEATFDLGLCADVMEHMPPEKVDDVLANIIHRNDRTWFNISLKPDRLGAKIGETLHMTVRPFTWWRDLLNRHGHLTDARHLLDSGIYVVRRSS